MSDVISRASCRPEPCNPYGSLPPIYFGHCLRRLTRQELERLAIALYSRDPVRFEQLLLQMWALRSPAPAPVLPAELP